MKLKLKLVIRAAQLVQWAHEDAAMAETESDPFKKGRRLGSAHQQWCDARDTLDLIGIVGPEADAITGARPNFADFQELDKDGK